MQFLRESKELYLVKMIKNIEANRKNNFVTKFSCIRYYHSSNEIGV